MAISKRLRYEVLRRDNYTCRYCGAKAPDVQLNVDAVTPEALGGSHKDPANLRTACEACNSGKSSSNPDAPLVAEVSEDALRWSRAISEAAAKMLADMTQRQDAYDRFDDWWGSWTYGFKKLPIPLPRPDGWESSIDSFLAAGLPLDVLEWCVRKAMASTAAPDGKWKYMCGIAWNKVRELQETAHGLAGGTSAGTGDEEISLEEMKGRASLACELLGDCAPEDIDWLLARARESWQTETEDDENIAAALIAWNQTRIDLSWLAFSLCDLLPMLPGDIIQQAMREARTKLYDESGPGFSRAAFVTQVVDLAVTRYESPLALAKETAPF